MTAPMMAPAMVPESETVFARYPIHDTIALTTMAYGSAAFTAGHEAANESTVMPLAIQSTIAAVAGTETLSSRRIGSVSTNAAAAAAAIGATRTKISDGSGVTAGRVHHASA